MTGPRMTPEQLDAIQARYDAAQVALLDDSSGLIRQLHRLSESANDVPALLALVREQQARIERVEALHQSSGGHNPACHCGVPAGSGANCIECGDVWPCPTIAALTATEVKA